MSEKLKTSIVTAEAVIGYPHLFEKYAGPEGDQKPKFSCRLLFEDGAAVAPLRELCRAVALDKWGEAKVEAMRKKKTSDGKAFFRLPFKPGNTEKGEPDGSICFNTNSEYQPEVIDGKNRPLAEEDVTWGDVVRALLNAYTWERKDGCGVSLGLKAILKVRDGANHQSAGDAFAEYIEPDVWDDPDGTPANPENQELPSRRRRPEPASEDAPMDGDAEW